MQCSQRIFIKLLCFMLISSIEAKYIYNPENGKPVVRHPIVIIPGLAGSQSYHVKNFIEDAKRIWVQAKYLLFPSKLNTYFRLHYDALTNKTVDLFGFNIFPGQYQSWSVEYLGRTAGYPIKYLRATFEYFAKMSYYDHGSTLIASPYDFRRATHENDEFVPYTQRMVESAYIKGGSRKVVLVGHSMGGLMLVNFLKKVPMSWKQMYVKHAVLVAAPLGGSIKMLKGIFSGDDFDIYAVRGKHLRSVINTFPSSYLMLPNAAGFGNKTVMSIRSQNYSPQNLSKIFDYIGAPHHARLYKNVSKLINVTSAPEGVDIDCVYGTGLPTISKLTFHKAPVTNEAWVDQDSELILDESPEKLIEKDGDGTVSLSSLGVCRKWGGRTRVLELPGAEHLDIITSRQTLKHIELLATSNQ